MTSLIIRLRAKPIFTQQLYRHAASNWRLADRLVRSFTANAYDNKWPIQYFKQVFVACNPQIILSITGEDIPITDSPKSSISQRLQYFLSGCNRCLWTIFSSTRNKRVRNNGINFLLGKSSKSISGGLFFQIGHSIFQKTHPIF
jgi:hypothetical protein